MGYFEQLAEFDRNEALEEGRQIGIEEATRRFVENLLNDSGFSTRKIASLAGISIASVQKIKLMSIIDQLTERKRKEILEECRARYYSDSYSIPYAKEHAKRYKAGLEDGIDFAVRRVIKNLLKMQTYSLKRIAFVVGVSLHGTTFLSTKKWAVLHFY